MRQILEVFDRKTVYEGGGRRCEPRWRKTADQKHLSATVGDILEAERARNWEYVRHGKGKGVREVTESDAGSISML